MRPLPQAGSPRGSPPPPAWKKMRYRTSNSPDARRRLADGGESLESARSKPQEDEEPRKLTRGGFAREMTRKMCIWTRRDDACNNQTTV
jgi:hypothetical protein